VSVNRSVLERLRPQFVIDFTKFCRNVVDSTSIVCKTKRK